MGGVHRLTKSLKRETWSAVSVADGRRCQHREDLGATCKREADEALRPTGLLDSRGSVVKSIDITPADPMINIPWPENPYFTPVDIMYIFLTECLEILSLPISSCTPSNQIFQNSKHYVHLTLSV